MIGQGPTYGARLPVHLKDVLDRFELTDGRMLRINTDNASSHYWMTRELQSTRQASRIEWPALRNHIPCMTHGIQLALGLIHEQSRFERPHQVLGSP
jgi:hypothetical protein